MIGSRLRAAAAAALLAGALAATAAPAGAQAPTPTPAAPAPPAATPAPPPATPALTLRATNVQRAGAALVALAGDGLEVRGTIAPYVAGEGVVLRIRRNGKRTGTTTLPVADAGNGTGTFATRVQIKRPGRVSVRATHPVTPVLGAAAAPALVVRVVVPRAAMGLRGPLATLLQARLAGMRYAVSRSGVYDAATSRAVMAFRKVNGLGRAFTADTRTVRRILARTGGWRVRHPGAGRHVEADLSLQALALIDGKRVVRIHHTSSGAPATPTVLGSFRVYLKTPGTNAKGMVHSSYFIRGYAIHGYVSVPAFNASHGCLRVPIPDARAIYDWLRVGDRVIVEP